jgi:hypothetical protein
MFETTALHHIQKKAPAAAELSLRKMTKAKCTYMIAKFSKAKAIHHNSRGTIRLETDSCRIIVLEGGYLCLKSRAASSERLLYDKDALTLKNWHLSNSFQQVKPSVA